MTQTIFEQVFLMLGGIMVFMYGMSFMGSNLEKAAGGKMKKWMSKISNKRLAGVGIGAGVTAIIQSSAATTVMLVGFVNIGLMTLTQAATIIMGANIGTTITAQLVSLEGLNLFDVTAIASVVAAAGFIVTLVSKNKTRQRGGRILMGLGMLFLGLKIMSESVGILVDEVPAFTEIFLKVSNPILLLLIGILVTAIIQSSSAITGILIILAGSGAITLEMAIFVTLGSNIGTCVTALISTIGTGVNAKRTAVIHLLFNVIGVLIVLAPALIWKTQIANALATISGSSVQRQIANFHTIFNILTTLVLLPFVNVLVKIASFIVPEKKTKDETIADSRLKYLDPHILETPPIAVGQVKKEIIHMADTAFQNYTAAVTTLVDGNYDRIDEIEKTEDDINYLNQQIATYLVKIIASEISTRDKNILSSYYHVISDIERIGDYAENIVEYSVRLRDENLEFSDDAKKEVLSVYENTKKLYEDVMYTFETRNLDKMEEINEVEDRIDDAKTAMSEAHIERLNKGVCTPVTGALYLSTASNLERIADHMVNIAVSVKPKAQIV